MRVDKLMCNLSGLSLILSLGAMGCAADEPAAPASGVPGTAGSSMLPTLPAPNAPAAPSATPAGNPAAPTPANPTPANPTPANPPAVTPSAPTPGAPAASPDMGATAPASPGGSGGSSDKPITYNDPMMKCYEFRAHVPGNKDMPFSVPNTPDLYTNFEFVAPWTGMMYARSFRVKTDNAGVIHHWLFYKNNAADMERVEGSIGAHPDGELVHGWAPGGSDLFMDPDVGIEMPGNVSYTLETHHNNAGAGPAPDRSGIEVCVTPTAPTNVASLSWLGTDNINGTTASGVCQPNKNVPVRIIGVQPHMHTKGTHMSGIITRADGKTETLHDQPFDFSLQHSYVANTTLMPGDSIKTTCTFNAPATFGEGTTDEMCYLFTLYYPKLSLTNDNAIPTLIHGPNSCLQ